MRVSLVLPGALHCGRLGESGAALGAETACCSPLHRMSVALSRCPGLSCPRPCCRVALLLFLWHHPLLPCKILRAKPLPLAGDVARGRRRAAAHPAPRRAAGAGHCGVRGPGRICRPSSKVLGPRSSGEAGICRHCRRAEVGLPLHDGARHFTCVHWLCGSVGTRAPRYLAGPVQGGLAAVDVWWRKASCETRLEVYPCTACPTDAHRTARMPCGQPSKTCCRLAA